MAAKDRAAVQSQRWADLVASLSPTAQAAIAGAANKSQTDEQRAYQGLLSGLSDDAREGMTPSTKVADVVVYPDAPPDRNANYILVEQIEGDWIKIKSFKKPQELARRISELEKSNPDSCVFAIYGMHLPMTKSPDRMLILPNDTVMRIKNGKFVRALDGPLNFQDDGFLGLEEMAPVETPLVDDDEEG